MHNRPPSETQAVTGADEPNTRHKTKSKRTREKKKEPDKKRQEVATREGTVLACEPGVLLGRLGMLSSQISSSLAFSYLLFFFSSFILTCLLFSSLLLSSLIVASLYSLLFLSSFRFWGVFHRWSLRPPPLTDPVLPYLSLSHL